MPVPPPPPPPPPMPGFGFGGGPPPPPPGGAPMPKPAVMPNQSAVLSDISSGGFRLKKTVTNDRSAPIVEKKASGPASSGLARPPTLATPPISGPAAAVASAAASRLRRNSSSTVDASTGSAMATAPQLGGLFAGGMPKLRKAKGAVETGADRDSSYMTNSSAPAIPPGRPPQIPGRPSIPSAPPSAPNIPTGRKTTPHTHERPAATATISPPRRRLSLHGLWDTNRQSPTAGPHAPRGAPPPPPPPPGARPQPLPVTNRAPPIPPPSRGTPPPPPPPPSLSAPPPLHAHGLNGPGKANSIAAAVARKVSGTVYLSPATTPPSIPPPPPPASAPIPPVSAPPPPPPPPPTGRGLPPPAPPSVRSPNPNSFTLVNNGTKRGERIIIDDKRWKWKPESDLPKPQEFKGLRKVYRSGRGSSVPLDLSAYE